MATLRPSFAFKISYQLALGSPASLYLHALLLELSAGGAMAMIAIVEWGEA